MQLEEVRRGEARDQAYVLLRYVYIERGRAAPRTVFRRSHGAWLLVHDQNTRKP